MDSSRYLIQNIFKSYAGYLQTCNHPLKNIKAIHAITHCRTSTLGVSYFSCEHQHTPIEQYHSCRHRSCFLCAQKSRRDWIERQRERLFDTAHFHVVFTLPHEYLNIWRYNSALFTRLIFKASRETLTDLMGDKKYHDVTPGILMALHTWGRQLTLHPHTHCLVTAGGLTPRGDWKNIDDYLLPIRVVKSLYRGKMQSFIRQAWKSGELSLPPDISEEDFSRAYKQAYAKAWSVRIEERYDHGKGVMLYLARYFKGGPINPAQITDCTHRAIAFRYLDHRDKQVKTLHLRPEDFLKRLLDHVPATGVHTVRHYGLYASSNKARRLHCGRLLGDLSETKAIGLTTATMLLFCKVCGGVARHTHSLWRRHAKGNSFNKERAGGFVQQDDEHDIASAPRSRDPCQLMA